MVYTFNTDFIVKKVKKKGVGRARGGKHFILMFCCEVLTSISKSKCLYCLLCLDEILAEFEINSLKDDQKIKLKI